MDWQVLAVEPTSDYKLYLTFKGGVKKVFDFSPMLEKEINKPLRNINFFMKAKVHHHTVMWNDNLDLCPEYLFENSVAINSL
ncbi:MAG: DUF2442 domain-containing protein [Treponema sp.]|nr:DUF2442 domain-containing protein [Treponema sp.]